MDSLIIVYIHTLCGLINKNFCDTYFANQGQKKLCFAMIIFANYGDLKKIARLNFAMDRIQ